MENFNHDLERGKAGEALVATALTARGHIVEDVSDNWDYRRIDIDFLLTSATGDTTTLEVKTDDKSELTGNVFIEYSNIHNKSHNYNGWYYYCEADYLAFVQQNRHKCHIVSRYDLINSINNNNYRTANTYSSSGFLMPVSALTTLPSYFLLEV